MKDKVFNIKTALEFKDLTLQVFEYQFKHNNVYRSFCDLLNVHPSDVENLDEIPFLPIEFFKSHKVLSSVKEVQKIFSSSGTTGKKTSRHLVTDLGWYQQSYCEGFKHFYGNIEQYTVLALLPGYLERDDSSLVYMVHDLINKSKKTSSGFYLNNLDELTKTITQLDQRGEKVLLIGVSFALLDLIEKEQFHLQNTMIMETGGMKGRRREITRMELHQILKEGFGVSRIHSEYGMTELLSQGYSKGDGVFECPPWMKVLIRDVEDPLTVLKNQKTGGINIIDLANYHSCAFIATQDLGRNFSNGRFEVLGRFDHSDIRGCNLMVI